MSARLDHTAGVTDDDGLPIKHPSMTGLEGIVGVIVEDGQVKRLSVQCSRCLAIRTDYPVSAAGWAIFVHHATGERMCRACINLCRCDLCSAWIRAWGLR